jgi:hypothetical protein
VFRVGERPITKVTWELSPIVASSTNASMVVAQPTAREPLKSRYSPGSDLGPIVIDVKSLEPGVYKFTVRASFYDRPGDAIYSFSFYHANRR